MGWFADAWGRGDVDYYLTLARGISPRQLVDRVAGGPVEQLPDMTPREADARTDMRNIYTIGRLAVVGGWSLLVETGASDGMLTPPDVSRDGAEVLIFDPRQDDPPSFFTYLKNGELLLHLPTSSPYDRGGLQPDVLLPALLAAGLITEDGPTEQEMRASPAEVRLRTIRMLGDHFDIDVPKTLIEDAPLPAVLLRTTPPSTW